jgi:hypothetical protein
VGNIRATVFWNLVESRIKKQKPLVEQVQRGIGRPDLQFDVMVDDEPKRVRVFPAFAVGGGYWEKQENLQRRAKRLAARSDLAFIVVPPLSKVELEPPVEGVQIKSFDALRSAAPVDGLLAPNPEPPDPDQQGE